MDVNDEFKILFELLEDGAPEVTGRAAIAIPSDVREKLARFAAGSCSETEREQMKQLLQEQPDFIGALVKETIALRPAQT